LTYSHALLGYPRGDLNIFAAILLGFPRTPERGKFDYAFFGA
jgi:hypothetical protein